MEMIISITVGNQVDGLRVNRTLTQTLFPNDTAEQAVEKTVNNILGLMVLALVTKQGVDVEDAGTLVSSNITRNE